MSNNNSRSSGSSDPIIAVYLAVEGMMCQRNCGTTVRNALLSVPDCLSAEASFAESRAVATFANNNDSKTASYYEQLAVEAVEDVGFAASVMAEPPPTVVHLKVTGMMCQKNCGTTVQNALGALEDCVEARAVYAEGRAVAYFDASAASSYEHCVEEAIDAVECVGFEAELISDIDAYLHRVRQQNEAEDGVENEDDNERAPIHHTTPSAVGDHEIVLRVSGMSCAVCTGRVERALRHAVVDDQDCRIAVVLANATAVVEFGRRLRPPERERLTAECAAAVQRAGYECQPVSADGNNDGGNAETLHDAAEQMERAVVAEWKSWRRLLVAAVSITIPLLLIDKHYRQRKSSLQQSAITNNSASDADEFGLWLLLALECVLSSLVQFGVGKRFYVAAFHGWRDRVLGMDFLVCLGTTASYVYSVVLFLMFTFVLVLNEDDDNDEMSLLTLGLDPTFTTGAMLLSFVTLGKFLESFAKGKTASALHTLMELQPLFAFRVLEQNPDATDDLDLDLASLPVEEVAVKEIRVGDLLRVLPGARIPTDGKLVAISAAAELKSRGLDSPPDDESMEQAFVDESALSGEPFPVAKSVGETVTGSTVNQLSVLLVRVTAVGEATALSKIVRLMERAQRDKAPIQAYADRIACIFAPAVLALASVTFAAWLILNDRVTAEERFFWAFTSGIAVIVVACPCALGLATPTAVMVGTGVGATHGLLIKGGAVLENMHSVDTVVFDKTGTLTSGRAILGADRSQEILSVSGCCDALFQDLPKNISKENLSLWLAACAEAQSEHPLAKAIVNSAKSRWGDDVTCAQEGVRVDKFRVVPGRGVECWVFKPGWGEWNVRVGDRSWTKGPVDGSPSDAQGLAPSDDPTGDEQATALRVHGQIAVYVSVANANSRDRCVVGVFGIVDPIQKESRSTVAALQGMGVEVWLCTGDHELTARAVAHEIGIHEDNICAGVTPEGKADLVTRLQRRHRSARGIRRIRSTERVTGRVAVVGDGINDAVALARADVGIAIGAGTEVAVEAADVVLVRSSLHDVVVALHLSKVVFRRIMMNFLWAMGYNVFALPFAAGVLYPFTDFRLPPELAGLMMAFSSVSVVTSSLLLRRYRRPVIREDGHLEGGAGCLVLIEKLLMNGYLGCCRCMHGASQLYENVPLKSPHNSVDFELV